MRISDWSSDVCSSDLLPRLRGAWLCGSTAGALGLREPASGQLRLQDCGLQAVLPDFLRCKHRWDDGDDSPGELISFAEIVDGGATAGRTHRDDRKSGVEGKGVSVGVGLGGGRM